MAGVVVIGAHYDHLGFGEHHSLAPDSHLPHLGADDNASGTATVLEIARQLAARPQVAGARRRVRRVLGRGGRDARLDALHAHAARRAEGRRRARDDQPRHGRAGCATTAPPSWARRRRRSGPGLLAAACGDARIDCAPSPEGGFGPSDQMPFYAAGVPVVHFFTGSHSDYHKPSDAADRINAAGAAPDRRGGGVAGDARRGARRRLHVPAHDRTARRGRRAQLQRVAGDDPGLRRSARRRAGRAAGGRARRRAGREGRPASGRHPDQAGRRTRSAASRT